MCQWKQLITTILRICNVDGVMLGVAIVVDGGDNDVIALAVDGQLLGRRQGGRGYFINLIEIFMNASFCFR